VRVSFSVPKFSRLAKVTALSDSADLRFWFGTGMKDLRVSVAILRAFSCSVIQTTHSLHFHSSVSQYLCACWNWDPNRASEIVAASNLSSEELRFYLDRLANQSNVLIEWFRFCDSGE
jgi:hypothetical protein